MLLAILVAPIVGHRLTMLVFTTRQVRNRLLISAFHIKTPSLLSHCLFHLPLHPPPFICNSPPANLSVWINYATLSLPLPHSLAYSNFAFGASHRTVLPIEFLPQFCQCRYLSNSEGVHQIIFRDRSIQSPSLSLTLSLPLSSASGQKLKHLPQVGRPIVRSPPKPQVWGGLILLPKRTRQEQQFGIAHHVGFHSSK